MFIFSLILLFPIVLSQEITEHLKKYINNDYPPCLDFYRHVCPTNFTTNDLYDQKIPNTTRAFLSAYTAPADPLYQEIVDDARNHFDIVDKIMKEKNYTLHIAKVIDTELEHEGRISALFEIAIQLPAYINFFKSNVGKKLTNKLMKYEAMMKDIMEQRFKETPWIMNNEKYKDAMVGRLRLIEMYNNLEEMEQFLVKVRPLAENYKDCKEKLKETNENPLTFCFERDLAAETTAELWTVGSWLYVLNGRNFGAATYVLGFPAMWPALADDVVLAADAIITMGHEIGHEFFENESRTHFNDDIRVTNETACIKKIKDRVCDLFSHDHPCSSSDQTFTEDVADVFALDVGYEIVRELMGNRFKEPSSEFPWMTNEQRYFYTITIPWCVAGDQINPKIGEDAHSSAVDRVYLRTWHSSYFKDAFNCPNDSPMVLEEEQKCHLFGKQAKPYKHRMMRSL